MHTDTPAKPPLLLLCHRIPYPPNKGDKIRSYHLLCYLSTHYQVYLGAFVDDPDDWAYLKNLEELCEEVCLVKLNPKIARLKSLWGLPSRQALSLPYYFSREMAAWVDNIFDRNTIERVFVYSAVMAQYLLGERYRACKKIADMVDVDSEKWREYSRQKNFPMNWVYRREADYLLKFEKHLADSFHRSLFVSEAEAAKFIELAPETRAKVDSYSNGVDTDYFCPGRTYPSPYQPDENVVVFTGAMDYWPNIDAVSTFAADVFPSIIDKNPKARFYIVGNKPPPEVRKLGVLSGVVVTGRVDDIRPYLAHAALAVAPMRIARGVQNKVLEAMSMACPVIVSEAGIEGINVTDGEDVLVARQASDYIELIQDVMMDEYQDLGRAARARVKNDFSWQKNLQSVGDFIEGAIIEGARP